MKYEALPGSGHFSLLPVDEVLAQAERQVICNIGQVSDVQKRALNRAVKAGKIAKWRGCWYPVAGASYGIGPLKTCWGPK